jgi:integrase
MHLFGQNVDHDYYFELLREGGPRVPAVDRAHQEAIYAEDMSRYLDAALEATLGAIRLRDFRKRDAIAALEVMADKGLVRSTIQQGRTLLGSLFKRACVRELVEHNPIRDFETPHAENDSRHKGRAYTAEEVEAILRVLTGRARVIAAILAYTGIRPQKLAGLDWADYDGDWLHIRRAVWQGRVVDVKTEESAANIPTVQPLREILDAYRATAAGVGWLISGDTAQPINLGQCCTARSSPGAEEVRHPVEDVVRIPARSCDDSRG